MTNKSEKPGGNDSGGGSGSKRRRGKKGKNTPSDSQSTASSSKTTSPKIQNQKQKQPEPTSSSTTPKIQILKRDPSKNVTMPLVACVKPLMEVNLSDPPQPQPPTTPKYHQNPQNHQNPPSTKTQNQRIYQTPEKSEKSAGGMNTRRSEANKQQTQAYYFSQNPGVAVSGDKFKQPSQYKMHNFPLEKLVNIFIEGKYSLMITPTNSRCNGLFIRVESQHQDFKPTGALLSLDSDDETIRNACLETIRNFDIVTQKSATDRYPYSKCSEPYLKSCLIKRLDDRLDAFPDAIYYCEKCDYHISTMSHARSHLESSSHFDDIKRQEQREHLVRHIPKPSKNHLRSIRKLLDDVLDDYKNVQEIGNEKASHILYYLQTTVFPAAIGGNRNVQLRPFGSATYDTVMPDSDYNVAYTMDLPENEPIFSMLEKVRKRIVDDGHPADHSMEMGTPSTILFTFEGVRVRLCWMSCFNYRSQLYFTDLMKTYVSLREEVVHFLQLIRLWACKAGVDSKNKPRIGLPRYGFDIMAIHFLQNQGLLPILHEMYEEDKTMEFDEQSLNSAAGDDASERSRIPPEEAGPRRMRLMSKYEMDVEKIRKKFNLTKQWDQADLFIKFFKYYVEKNRDIVVQITQTAPISRDANRWNKKVLHVVDPFRGDNVLSIPKVSTWQPYYFNCLLTTYLSFAIPRTKDGPLVEISLIHSKSAATKKKVKEPQTPKRSGEPPISTTPMHNIPEEDYNRAADLLAEEAENEKYMNDLKAKLMFDGIKYKDLKPTNFEIDDHWQSVYSRKALTRFRRVWPTRLNERIAIPLEDHDLLNNKFGKKWMKRWRKGELGRSESLEMPEVSKEEEEEEDRDVAEITEKMEEMLGIVESEESQRSHSEETPVTVIEKDLVSQQSEIKDESMVMSEIEENEAEKDKDASIPEDPQTSEAIVMCIRSVEEPESPEVADDVKDSEVAPKAPEASESVVPTKPDITTVTSESSAILTTPSKSTIQKTTATFVKTKAIPVAEKQICCEEFFIKENVDFKEIAVKAKRLHQYEFQFEFSSELFCGGYEMEMKCTHCDGSHCVEKCPMMEIPPIIKYEARTPEELKDIDDIIDRYYQENILNDARLKLMEERKTELERFMKEKYQNDVNLTIFGSVMTGLSVNCSDIDICLRFGSGDTPPKDRTPKEVILRTERVLRNCGLVRKVQSITTAKVPIVKFQLLLINDEYIDADISYYNILAIYNTALLKEYTLWTPDHRFAKLALYIKRWAKHCDIGDASRGSLSSYAHIIMLISYLQNCDPPVLPRLQEDFRSDNDEKRLVENWDTSYAQVESQLLETWPKNKESCAQLLIGYFDYYSRFDFRNFVVQCRREMILSKMEKDWPRPLCVEDPFDLHHNLSSGITKKMFVFIMKVFINSRAVFMSEKPTVARDFNFVRNYQDQLLRKCHQGSAPSDRQCHNCHRIGHFFESCPLKPIKDARRRYGSNSTNSSYRSNEGYRNYRATSDDSTPAGGDRLISHKRVKTFHSRK